jgi:hypothetical protein
MMLFDLTREKFYSDYATFIRVYSSKGRVGVVKRSAKDRQCALATSVTPTPSAHFILKPEIVMSRR